MNTSGTAIRVLTCGLLLLGLGLTTSVAIAWGATVWFITLTPMHQTYNLAWQADRTSVTIAASARRAEGGAMHWSNNTDRSFPVWSRFQDPPLSAQDKAIEFASGWPFVCMTYFTHAERLVNFDYFRQRYEGAMFGHVNLRRFNKDWHDIQYLPRRPLAMNLLLDAMFWGLAWLMMLNSARIWRLNIWLRRSPKERCAWCGYQLKQLKSDRCPECGNVHNKPPTLIAIPALRTAAVMLVFLVLGEAAFVGWFVSQRQGEPIHRAALLGDLADLKTEIARGVDINTAMKGASYTGLTPLMLAIQSGHRNVVDFLIDLGADLDVVALNSGNALTLAIRLERAELVSRLLEAGAAINLKTGDQFEPLNSAMALADVELFGALIEAGADVKLRGIDGISPLDWLMMTTMPVEAREEMVRMLLEAGVDPNPPLLTRVGAPLQYVIRRNELVIARMLLDAGHVIEFESLAVAVALEQSQPEMLQLLIEYGARFDMTGGRGQTLFHAFTGNRADERLWRPLLERGVPLDAIDNKGKTALMAAVERPDWDLVRFLLKHGADPTITAAGGLTVVDLASQEQMKAILREAIEGWEAEHGKAEPEEAESGD